MKVLDLEVRYQRDPVAVDLRAGTGSWTWLSPGDLRAGTLGCTYLFLPAVRG